MSGIIGAAVDGTSELNSGAPDTAAANLPDIPWQLERPNWSQQNKYLLENQIRTDCVFVVGETETKRFECHKFLLGNASPVFEAMLFRPLDDDDKVEIQVPDIEPETFQAMLEYIYTREVKLTSINLSIKLFYAAEKYMLPQLKKTCMDNIRLTMRLQDAIPAYELAVAMNNNRVKLHAWKVILERADKVLQLPNFVDSQAETVLAIVQQDSLPIKSETQIVSACFRWAQKEAQRQGLPKDLKSLREALGEIFQHIRFLALSLTELNVCAVNFNFLTPEENIEIEKIIKNSELDFKFTDIFCNDANNRSFISAVLPEFRFFNTPRDCKNCRLSFISNNNSFSASIKFEVDHDIKLLGIATNCLNDKNVQVLIQDEQKRPLEIGDLTNWNSNLKFKIPVLIQRNCVYQITFIGNPGECTTPNVLAASQHKELEQHTGNSVLTSIIYSLCI